MEELPGAGPHSACKASLPGVQNKKIAFVARASAAQCTKGFSSLNISKLSIGSHRQ